MTYLSRSMIFIGAFVSVSLAIISSCVVNRNTKDSEAILESQSRLGPEFSVRDLLQLNVSSVTEALSAIDQDTRDSAVLVYDSRSSSPGAPGRPRIVLSNRNGTAWFAFNSDPAGPKAGLIEAIEFDQESKTFKMALLEERDGTLALSNETGGCARCHTKENLPVWDVYPVWPGSTGSEHNEYGTPAEDQWLREALPQLDKTHRTAALGKMRPTSWDNSFNQIKINMKLVQVNAFRIAQQITDQMRDGDLERWMPALISASWNLKNFVSFVPPERRHDVEKRYDNFRSKYATAVEEYDKDRDRRQEAALQKLAAYLSVSTNVGTYKTSLISYTGRDEFKRLAKVASVASALGVGEEQIKNWSLTLGREPVFSDGHSSYQALTHVFDAFIGDDLTVRRKFPRIEPVDVFASREWDRINPDKLKRFLNVEGEVEFDN